MCSAQGVDGRREPSRGATVARSGAAVRASTGWWTAWAARERPQDLRILSQNLGDGEEKWC